MLAPAEIAPDDYPLVEVSREGTIVADGGLVKLDAYTAYKAVREAINMKGVIKANSVSEQPGRIVFGTGEGSPVNISGELDVGPKANEDDAPGGHVEIVGSKVDLDFSKLRIGEGGSFRLAADRIWILSWPGEWDDITVLVEYDTNDESRRSDIGDLLRSGVNVTLHGSWGVRWGSGGLAIMEDQVRAGTKSGKAGDLHLLAAEEITLGGLFNTYNSNWTLTANAVPATAYKPTGWAYIRMYDEEWARFTGDNGLLALEILHGDGSAGLFAGDLELPEEFHGVGLSATNATEPQDGLVPYIMLRGDVTVSGDIELYGNLWVQVQTTGDKPNAVTLKGKSVTWLTEDDGLLRGGLLKFVEVRDNGKEVITRFGRGVNSGNVTRLTLGNVNDTFSRHYGDPDPDQVALGSQLSGSGMLLTQILAPGSIAVSGPGPKAGVSKIAGEYYLTLTATDGIAFKGTSGGYWINLAPEDLDGDGLKDGAKIPLWIEPRPVTIVPHYLTYIYGDPQPFLKTASPGDILPGDDVELRVSLTWSFGSESKSLDETGLRPVGDGFQLWPHAQRGTYSYSIGGFGGEDAVNYVLVLGESLSSGQGEFVINPRPITISDFQNMKREYGSALLPTPSLALEDVMEWDRDRPYELVPVVELFVNGQRIENSERLPVGTYTAKVVGLSGELAHNYEVVGEPTAQLEVEPRVLTWQVSSPAAVYGDPVDISVSFLQRLVDGDNVEAVIGMFQGQEEIDLRTRIPAGTYTVVVTGLSGEHARNYRLAESGNMPATLTINRRPLQVVTDPIALIYGDTSGGRGLGENPLPVLKGVLPGDEVQLTGEGFYRVQKDPEDTYPRAGLDIPVGHYFILAYSDREIPLTGRDSANYVLHGASVPEISLEVRPKPITYTITVPSFEYGDPDFPTAVQVTLNGLVPGDAVESELDFWRDGTPWEWSPLPDVGDYTVALRTLTGPAAGNYVLAETGNTIGQFSVIPRLINPSLSSYDSVYGDPVLVDFEQGVKLQIGVRLDDGTIIKLPDAGNYNGKAVVAELVGDYAYRYRLPAPDERNTGNLWVQKRPVTVKVLDQGRTYGDPTAWVQVEFYNRLPGDDLYAGHLTFWASGGQYIVSAYALDHPNYTLASEGNISGTVTIWPRPVRYITKDVTMVYGDNEPSSRYTAELFDEDILPGDDVTAGGVVVRDRDAYPEYLQAGRRYPLIPILEGLAAGNYELKHEGSEIGYLYVAPRPLQVIGYRLAYNGNILVEDGRYVPFVFGDFEKKYGLINPYDPSGFEFVDVAELWGIVGNDDVRFVAEVPELSFSTFGYLAVGDYVIKLGLAGSSARNYTLADDLSVTLQIQPRPISVTVTVNKDYVYGDYLSPRDIEVHLDFGDDDDSLIADVELAPLWIGGPDLDLTWDELWSLGTPSYG